MFNVGDTVRISPISMIINPQGYQKFKDTTGTVVDVYLIGGSVVLIQVGDRVRVRRLKDLTCEYMEVGIYDEAVIENGSVFSNLIDKGSSFVNYMRAFCGLEIEINSKLSPYRGCVVFQASKYPCNFNTYMLEHLDGSLIDEN